jgi:hypothetical protein
VNVALAWLLYNPAVRASIFGLHNLALLNGNLRALEIKLNADLLKPQMKFGRDLAARRKKRMRGRKVSLLNLLPALSATERAGYVFQAWFTC